MACSTTVSLGIISSSSRIESSTRKTFRLTKTKFPMNIKLSPFLARTQTFPKFASAPKRSFVCRGQTNAVHDESRPIKEQVFRVYEMNERDRGSPIYLRLSQKTVNSLGDLVPVTNKLYTGDLQKRIGISAGICILIQNKPEKKGDLYEVVTSFHFGDYGQLTMQGAYTTYGDTYLAVTGGTGIFQGAYGQVKVQNLVYPLKLFYTFHLNGIKDLPAELMKKHVEPGPTVEPSAAARACEPHAVFPNYSD